MKEERFPHHGNPLHFLRNQPGQIGSFRGSEESAAAEQRETSAEALATSLHVPVSDACLLVCTGTGY